MNARVAATLVMVATCAAGLMARQVPASDRLSISEKDGFYQLAVPVSRLVLAIPKAQLAISQGPSDSPRYFILEDKSKGLTVSGWFEPEFLFRGMTDFWAAERRSMTQQGLELLNIAEEKIGTWQVVFYDVALPNGSSSHVRAEWLQAGTWIDLHLSVSGNHTEAQGRKVLKEVLGTINVTEKKAAASVLPAR